MFSVMRHDKPPFGFCFRAVPLALSLITVALLLSCAPFKKPSPSPVSHPLDVKVMESLMASVDPWPGFGTNYDDCSWSQLASAAKIVQMTPPTRVQRVLHEYQIRAL